MHKCMWVSVVAHRKLTLDFSNLIYSMNMIHFGIHIAYILVKMVVISMESNRIRVTFTHNSSRQYENHSHLDIASRSNLGDPMTNSAVCLNFIAFSIGFKFKQLIRFKAERCEITSINSFGDVITSTQSWSNEIGHDNFSAQYDKMKKTRYMSRIEQKNMVLTNFLWHLAAVYLHSLKCRRCVTSSLRLCHITIFDGGISWRRKGTCTPYIPSNWMNRFQLESNICALSSLRSLDGNATLAIFDT